MTSGAFIRSIAEVLELHPPHVEPSGILFSTGSECRLIECILRGVITARLVCLGWIPRLGGLDTTPLVASFSMSLFILIVLHVSDLSCYQSRFE